MDAVSDQARRGLEILVQEGLIAAVRPVGGPAPDGIPVLELPDATVLPGLVDCHVHYTIDPRLDVADGIADGGSDPPQRCVLVGARNAREALRSGVTTARSAGASRGLDIALAAAIERGDVPGPRLLAAGPAITITGGHGRHFGIEVDSVTEMIRAVRRIVADGAQVIKAIASEAAMLTTGLAGVQELSREELAAIVAEAHRLERRVLAHAQGAAAVVAAAEAGVDSIEHAFLAGDAALRSIATSGAFLTPTLSVTDVYAGLEGLSEPVRARQRAISAQHRASCERAIELGIPLVAGTDCGVRGVLPDMLPREILLLADHGLTPIEAIRSGTVRGAQLLGLSDEIGTVEVGKRADLLVVRGDPLADLDALADPLLVVKHGQRISL